MRKPIHLIVLIMLLVCAARTAHAELKDYIDEKTVLAGEADLSKVDPMALEMWVRKVVAAMGTVGNGPHQAPPKELDEQLGVMRTWLSEFAKSGGKQVYVVATGELIKDGAVAIIAPADTPERAKQLASVLFSGKANGPTSRPANPNMGRYTPSAEVIRDGKAAVYGTANARRYAATVTPKDRPDITAALASSGDVPGRLAFIPDEATRQAIQMFVPMKDVKWLTLGADVPPKASLKAIAQAPDAAAAKSAADTVTMLIKSIPPSAKFTPKFIELITPTVTNDQVVLALDNDKLLALAAESKAPLQAARSQAMQTTSLSNMRMIVMGLNMYSNDNRGKWPDDLNAIDKYLAPDTQRVMTNPDRPGKGYVYVKPAKPRENTATTPVLYEEHDDFGGGVAVGFADGHVEMVKDPKRFKDLLDATKAK